MTARCSPAIGRPKQSQGIATRSDMKTFSPSRGFGLAVTILAVSLLAARAEAQKSREARTLVLQGGTLIDGTGKAPLENAVIGYLIKTPEDARATMRKKKESGLDIVKFNEYVAPEAVRAGAEEANRLGLPITCHCLDVFLAAELGFAGVEHHWAPGMTSIDDVKRRWEIHEQRMTGKINTADLPFYYEPENFDKIIKAMAEKHVSWSPTIATWFRPLSPSAERFKERELSILNNPKARYLPAVLREQALGQYDRYSKFSPERLNQPREGYKTLTDFISRLVQAGGIIRAGSDPNNGLPALGVHQEMVMFVEAGLTPMQAIQAATINVAKTFRKDKDFSTVEPGKVADVIAVDGDPLKDIWAVQNVKMVVLNGKIVDNDFHADYKNP